MAKQLDVGVVVVCVHACKETPIGLIGRIGTITQRIGSIDRILLQMKYDLEVHWVVHFPETNDIPCPNCGGVHGDDNWPMHSMELRPLEDPYKDQDTDTHSVQDLADELTLGGW